MKNNSTNWGKQSYHTQGDDEVERSYSKSS